MSKSTKTIGVQHATTGHALQPQFTADGGEVCTQAIQHRGPIATGQVQSAGANASVVDDRGRHVEL